MVATFYLTEMAHAFRRTVFLINSYWASFYRNFLSFPIGMNFDLKPVGRTSFSQSKQKAWEITVWFSGWLPFPATLLWCRLFSMTMWYQSQTDFPAPVLQSLLLPGFPEVLLEQSASLNHRRFWAALMLISIKWGLFNSTWLPCVFRLFCVFWLCLWSLFP